jgi:hypothetical protein
MTFAVETLMVEQSGGGEKLGRCSLSRQVISASPPGQPSSHSNRKLLETQKKSTPNPPLSCKLKKKDKGLH